ncbi:MULTISPECIES: phosphopantetheine-binding protein [Micromonospora]|uniref:Acyl carrier protein n=2 Tax=Micromonospora TaxID=1873 RepID=A0A109IFQ1_9ACTN|nr:MULTISPECIES: phosphopantetheine-binding protein [Micromonospora]AGI61653.1 acyl carrier protein [Micromonospora sp. CMS I2-32]KWV29688.1 phosphopantetheine-binding protein [Micromonospora rifamycinica]WFE64830.1 phosphopantetheine-binding protein [Micromonospora sp. WMMD714]SCG50933.1 Acyl carrier protein [Micromonospora rifamycinica]
MWDQRFEAILRQHLPFLDAEEPLLGDTSLRDSGLDSLAMVELLATLESEYNVRFVDEAMSMETFATPQTLWGVMTELLGAPV